MECFKGYVNKIVYRNEDNGYTVFELSIDDDDDLTCEIGRASCRERV